MAGDPTELLRVARSALADMDARGLFVREPRGLRLPVPTIVAAAFLHHDVRRQLGHLEALKWRAHAVAGDAAAKAEAERLKAMLGTVPQHPARTLVAAAGGVLFLLAFAYFTPQQIGGLLKVAVSVVTLDFAAAYEKGLEAGIDGLWWRVPLYLALTYGPAHLLLLIGFRVKRSVLEAAAAPVAPHLPALAAGGVTRFDRLAAAAQGDAGGPPLPPAAFDTLSLAAVYIGFCGVGAATFYVGWIADSGAVLAAGTVCLLIGLGMVASSLLQVRAARRAVGLDVQRRR